jgi:hypothetical protein
MKAKLIMLALASVLAAGAGSALAQSGAPELPALSAEQKTNLDSEMRRIEADVDGRVARGELRPEEAERLLEWRRWQLARQIAGLVPPEPPRVIVRHEYAPPPPVYYDPWYPAPYWGRPYYWYGPRISVCAGRWGRHSFGSLCF